MNYLIADASIYTLAGVIGLAANSIQLIFSCRQRTQEGSVFGYSLLSLNIADILASLITLSLGLTNILAQCMVIDSALFKDLEYALLPAILLSVTSSFCHVIFIAMQRVIAVPYPLKVQQILNKTRSCILLVIMWFFFVTLAVVPYVFAFLVMITGITLTVLYSIVCYKTMNRNIVNNESEEQRRRRQQSDKDILLYSVSITILFMISCLPKAIDILHKYPPAMLIISHILFSLNPFFDTVLYFVWSIYKRRKRRQAIANHAQPAANLQRGFRDSSV